VCFVVCSHSLTVFFKYCIFVVVIVVFIVVIGGQYGGRDGSKRRAVANWSKRKMRSCQSLASRTRHWMHKALSWRQSTKIKSWIAAAAFTFAVYFGSVGSLAGSTTTSGSGGGSPAATFATASMNNGRSEVHVVSGKSRRAAAMGNYDDLHRVATVSSSASSISSKEAVKDAVVTAADSTSRTLKDAIVDLGKYMAGPKSDTLLLLLATALITPLCKMMGTSPILGFLASGMLLGPNGCGLISGIHTTETLAELGIVFFLFEMGIELSVERLLSMKRDVFGLGLSQFLGTACAIAGVGKLLGLPANALVVLGGGLALSSSAFVLQLLKDKSQLATRFGKACKYSAQWADLSFEVEHSFTQVNSLTVNFLCCFFQLLVCSFSRIWQLYRYSL
jgi:Sodium/hydrogen exchanger family